MAARVAGRRDHDEVVGERDGLVARRSSARSPASPAVTSSVVEDALAAEALRAARRGRRRRRDASGRASRRRPAPRAPASSGPAARGESTSTLPAGPLDEVAPGAEGALGREAAEGDVLVDRLRKRARRRPGVGLRETVPIEAVGQATSAMSARRRPASSPGWRTHEGVAVALLEDRRRDAAAGVAVDAGRVDVEVAGDVVREPAAEGGHGVLDPVELRDGPLADDVAGVERSAGSSAGRSSTPPRPTGLCSTPFGTMKSSPSESSTSPVAEAHAHATPDDEEELVLARRGGARRTRPGA